MPDSSAPPVANDDLNEAVSPAATGGEGTIFEHKVGAVCLATLLTGGQPFFLEAASLREVHLQTGHQGRNTDDIALTAIARDGTVRKALIQVKRSLTVSGKNGEFSDTIKKAFEDFRQEGRFNPNHDIVGIITSSLAANHARALTNLLDCARASLDTADFLGRLALKGYLGKPTSKDFEVIKSILGMVDQAPDDEGVWRFLRSLRITDIDLHQDNGLLETCVQSLLTATCMTPGDAAETWRQLRVIASDGTVRAQSFTRERLPEELQRRHSKATGYGDGLTRLLDASEIVFDGVFSELSLGITVPRGELQAKLSETVENSHMVLITGNAGTGKSAAAKALFSTLRQDGIGLAFRATSLNGSHVDEALHPYGINLKGISEQSAAHQRKILWIESVEQLWERPSSERMAFFYLLQKLASDDTWRIILTCREYSSDLVASGIFEKLRIRPEIVTVKNFTEQELQSVATALPNIAPLINNPKLKGVIGNAFNLKLATQLRWKPEEKQPAHLRDFREKVWSDVVCKIDEPANNMPMRRNRVAEEIALKRAKSLTPFVDVSSMDFDALFRLVSDDVISQKNPGSTQHAPAHDVFEDWALILYLQRKFCDEHEENLTQLVAQLETHPAMRRAYRKWLIETIDQSPEFEAKVIELFVQGAVAAHWRDDTLAAILLSGVGNSFLQRNTDLLRANGAKLLRQAIHLLRVAGKVDIPLRKFGVDEDGDISLPKIRGWIGAAYAMYAAKDDFSIEDQSFVIGFIEDWIGLTRYGPDFAYPRGAEEIGKLILREIGRTPDSYKKEKRRKALFELLITLPLVAQKELGDMLNEALRQNDSRNTDHLILDLGFCHFKGYALVRDMPAMAIRIAEEKLGLNLPLENVINQLDRYFPEEMSHAFGLNHRYADDGEASAYNGPFLRLLQYHPEQGLEFILRFVNRCCEAYAHPENRYQHIEPPGKIRFKFSGNAVLEQIANKRLWDAYRGFSSSPTLFKSALMALEHWLLKKCEETDFDLEGTLLRLLKESNNVAISAVAASLVTAHAERSGEASLVLVGVRDFIMVDITRSAEEKSPQFMFGSFRRGLERLMLDERKAASVLSHRSQSLRDVVRSLQILEKFGARIDAILDAYKAELPPEENCGEIDIRWRIQLNNMDLRTHKLARDQDGATYLVPGDHTPAVQDYVEKKKSNIERSSVLTGWLVHWTKAFEGKLENEPTIKDVSEWLASTIALSPPETDADEEGHLTRMVGSAKVFAAATCIRDRWNELNDSHREWCANTVMDALDAKTQTGRRQFLDGGPLSGDTQAAYALIALVGKQLPSMAKNRLIPIVAQVITTDEHELQESAARGIATCLWNSDRDLALSCIHSMMTYSQEIRLRKTEGRRAHRIVDNQGDSWFEFLAKARDRAKIKIISKEHPGIAEILGKDWLLPEFRAFSVPMVLMVSDSFKDTFVQSAVSNLANALPEHWGRKRLSRRDEDDDLIEMHTKLMHQCVDIICHFVLQLSIDQIPAIMAKLKTAIVQSPDEGADVVKWLVLYQDDKIPADGLWTAWQLIANEFSDTQPTEDHNGLMRDLFLATNWQKTRVWAPIHGQEHRIKNLFEKLPTSPESIEHYAYYLNTIGSPLLPDGLSCLAEKLRDENSFGLLTPNAVFYLESILTRLWGENDFLMRNTADRRRMVLLLLDRLVSSGSSTAFRLRDDFVTPYAA